MYMYKCRHTHTHTDAHTPQHDTADPDPIRGAYIMYAFATSGNQPNNDQFSDRSIDTRMFPVISHAGQDRGEAVLI